MAKGHEDMTDLSREANQFGRKVNKILKADGHNASLETLIRIMLAFQFATDRTKRNETTTSNF